MKNMEARVTNLLLKQGRNIFDCKPFLSDTFKRLPFWIGLSNSTTCSDLQFSYHFINTLKMIHDLIFMCSYFTFLSSPPQTPIFGQMVKFLKITSIQLNSSFGHVNMPSKHPVQNIVAYLESQFKINHLMRICTSDFLVTGTSSYPTFGQMVKFSDAPKITSFSHKNMPRSSFIFSTVKWEVWNVMSLPFESIKHIKAILEFQ